MKKKILFLVPAFNESINVEFFHENFLNFIRSNDQYSFQLLFVDDGSSDDTLEKIKQLSLTNSKVRFISFSKNYGHQNALRAGLDSALILTPDALITMDADLQHPFHVVKSFLEFWEEGFEIVYSVRKKNPNLGWFKNLTSTMFYKILNFLSDINIEEGSADFRLIDKKIIHSLLKYKESDLFLRGLINNIGFKKKRVEYQPEDRKFGETKYSFSKMFKLAMTGITSFSTKPLYLSIILGLITSFSSFMYLIYSLIAKFYLKQVVSGWTSLMISVLFIGGVQLIVIGILGIYLGKVFLESKQRPNYLIKESNLS